MPVDEHAPHKSDKPTPGRSHVAKQVDGDKPGDVISVVASGNQRFLLLVGSGFIVSLVIQSWILVVAIILLPNPIVPVENITNETRIAIESYASTYSNAIQAKAKVMFFSLSSLSGLSLVVFSGVVLCFEIERSVKTPESSLTQTLWQVTTIPLTFAILGVGLLAMSSCAMLMSHGATTILSAAPQYLQ